MLRRSIRWLHLWVGLVLSLLLFVLALTGGALVYKEAYWRLVYPELRGPLTERTAAENAAAIAAARRAFGPALGSVKLPEPGVNAYHLYLEDGEAFVSVGDHRVIDRWRPRERAMPFLFDLHAHLMAGETGERVGGAVGLFGALLALSGIYLWWPSRRRFSLRGSVLPRSLARQDLIAWHRDMGLLWSPLLLVVLLSAGGIVFYDTAGRALRFALGDDPPAAAALAPGRAADVAASAPFAHVARVMPDARVVFYYPPTAADPVHRFRLRRPCELHPNGRSYVTIDGAGTVLEAIDACAFGAGTRAQHALYPLHSAKAMGPLYKAALFASAWVLAALAASGVLAYARRLLRGRRQPSRPAPRAAAVAAVRARRPGARRRR